MRAGRLKDAITLLHYVSAAPTAEGQAGGSWEVLAADVPAEYRTPAGTEEDTRAGQQAVRMAVFRIRHRPGLVETMRVTHRDTTYDVQHIQPQGWKDAVDLTCRGINPAPLT